MPITTEQVQSKLSNWKWRLDNIYTVIPESQADGQTIVSFKLREAQRELLDEWWTRMIVAKCRKIGYSTLLMLIALDSCIFNKNYKVSVIDFKEVSAYEKLDMVRNAWHNSEQFFGKDKNDPFYQIWLKIKEKVKLTHESKSELRWSNGSVFSASTSSMGSSPNLLIISELGPLAAQAPDRAAKLKRGTLNSVAPDSHLIIESTAEGASGIYYDLLQLALNSKQKDDLQKTEFKLLFKPWFLHPSYTLPKAYETDLDESTREYFKQLKDSYDIDTTLNQQLWYQIKKREIGDDMYSQYPSTLEESVRSTTVGQIYPQLQTLKSAGRIRKLTFDANYPLMTVWDIGVGDATCGVLFQVAGRDILIHRTFATNGSPASKVVEVIRGWEREFNTSTSNNFLPHDSMKRDQTNAKVYVSYLEDAGLKSREYTVLPRCNTVWNGIRGLRNLFPRIWFDIKCDDRFTGVDGESLPSFIQSLENYRRNPKSGEPLHDIYSNFADAARYLAEADELGLISSGVKTNNRNFGNIKVLSGIRNY